MVHLSARLSWHDSGWNASVCQNPHLNAHCIVHQVIRDNRDDDMERNNAGKHLTELDEWFPPCSRDIGAYAPIGFRLTHSDPLERDFLKPVAEDVAPYACMPAPYRWMREENFRDVCEAEGLSIRGPENHEKEVGWVYEPDRQRQLLNTFWDRLKEGVGHSLIFYYVNQGNPVDENAQRLIVGVGRLKDISPQLYFTGTDASGELYPIWTRAVTQDYPNQGFRLPYQEYIQNGYDPRTIACYVPKNAFLSFSFVGEHVTDDMAVGILERLTQSVEAIIQEDKIPGPWKTHLNWLNDRLADVWRGRGPFPGIGSVLQYLGFSRGTTFQRLDLQDFVRNNENPWAYVRSILDGSTPPPDKYADGFVIARRRWKEISRNLARLELLDALVRFELTQDQVHRICTPDDRQAAGIVATESELVDNPYIICETDLGTARSAPVDLNTIDHGMRPEGDASLFIPPEQIVVHDDTRRVRAIAVNELREAAEAGDSLLTFTDLLRHIRERFGERRACRPDREVVIAEADFHRKRLWLDLDSDPQLAALQSLYDYEQLISRSIKGRVKRRNQLPDPPPDWETALERQFGPPKTERERAAQDEKAAAMEVLFSKKISVLTGSAGTGKTSALKVFLNELDRIEGKKAVYLLAPTGKARVRLSSKTKRNAFTIHQLLYKSDWFLPDIFVLKPDGGGQFSRPTVIIDECSMVPTDLLGTLFKALKLDLVTRLILVGDPNQLPPIGPGRPFVDIVAWLQANHPDCVATLRTTMRIADESDVEVGESRALAFADGYRSDSVNPGDDEILSAIAQGKQLNDLEVHFWDDHDQLQQQLKGRMKGLLGVGEDGDYKKFNESFGLTDKPYKQKDWKEAEHWQILSPLRNQAFGTEELNRLIQHSYKRGLIKNSQKPWTKTPPPFGDQEIVYTDKVMQIYNRRMRAWPFNTGLDYVANGEIGLVTTTGRNQDRRDYLQVGFSTQDGVTYRYYRSEVGENLELAYALTIHKAQGSDFDYVFLIIPQEAATLCRELIYTGLTRFRKKLILLVEKDTGTLERMRLPDHSHTHSRNTNLFELSLRADPEEPNIPYPQHLIHRTENGVLMRSKSEVIVADVLDRLELQWEYEQKLISPKDERDFRLPDFTVGYMGDIYYWEHLGMLNLPTYRADWERKRDWYEQTLGLTVIGPGAKDPGDEPEPGVSPLVITSRDDERGGIDQSEISRLARKYIKLEE